MTLSSLRISQFRNLTTVDLTPSPQGLNIICGHNGSGKTSLLEAIYFLGLGRSFRSSNSSQLIQKEKDKFSIHSQVLSDAKCSVSMGIERDLSGNTRLKIAEKNAISIAELAHHLPIRLINSQSHLIFESGPTFRRKYLDWGLFYQFDSFLPLWRQFERVLKQRNAVLRDRRSKNELTAWTDELVKHTLELDKLRREYVGLLSPWILELTSELLGIAHFDINYQSGWDNSQEFATILANAYTEEIRSGYTQYGPHRADFNVTVDGVPVKHFLSRGQQKLLICAMMVAQGKLLNVQKNKGLIYLVDDLPSELDLQSRGKLMELLQRQKTQIFITAIEREMVLNADHSFHDPVKVFHVKHGSVLAR